MDNSWVDYWREKARKTRRNLGFTSLGSLILLIFSIYYEYFSFAPLLIIFTTFLFILFLSSFAYIKVKIRNIGETTICYYGGIITGTLIINGVEVDKCTFSNDYLYGQLPDGRHVCVKQSSWTGDVKITVGKDNDFNVML